MSHQSLRPRPIFADAESIMLAPEVYFETHPSVRLYLRAFPTRFGAEIDFQWACNYLTRHNRSPGTYGNYRGFVERLLLWGWIFAEKSALALNRADFGKFISFTQNPPENWIGAAPKARFLERDGIWIYNDNWRPFDVRSLSRSSESMGSFEQNLYRPFTGTMKQMISICSSFYNFLHAEGATNVNPIAAARTQRARSEKYDYPTCRSLSLEQWSFVIRSLEDYAINNPAGERALFIVTATYFMYLRASDLATEDGYCPTMSDFICEDDEWWLVLTRPRRQPQKIFVNRQFIPYLKRYRASRGLSLLPTRNEGTPMLETAFGRPGLTVRHIRDIVKNALKQAYLDLRATGKSDAESHVLLTVSLRWIRDSGAKNGAQNRPPNELQRDLRSVSLPYIYGRYYRE